MRLCSTVVSEVNGAVDLLKNLCIEMDRRYSVLAAAGCRDIDSYNQKFADSPMRRDIVFINRERMRLCSTIDLPDPVIPEIRMWHALAISM